MKVIIVGGVAGGATAAARLRRLDEKAQIIMVERGEFISFANCGLPYHIGGTIAQRDRLTLETPESFREKWNIEVRVHTEAIGIDRERRIIKLRSSDGSIVEESYDKVLLSPGAAPYPLQIPGADQAPVFSLRNIPDMDRIITFLDQHQPRKATVVGGGFIGLEMVENLVHRGLEVDLVELSNQVMIALDFEMASQVHQHLTDQGVGLFLNQSIEKVESVQPRVSLRLKDGSSHLTDMLILATGVVPETKLAKDAGLTMGKGGIQVNEWLQTSDPDIYAVGDAIEVWNPLLQAQTLTPLAGPANRQARLAADHVVLGDQSAPYEGAIGTSIAKIFDLTVAATGLNERRLKSMNAAYYTSIIHGNSHAGYYPESLPLTIKLLFDSEGKILGAQAVGMDGVDKRMDILATMIKMGHSVQDLTRLELAYAPPYGSAKDPVNIAGYVAHNTLLGHLETVSWKDVSEMDDPNTVFLDVRTAEERKINPFEKERTQAIPIQELRLRLKELDRSKTYITLCQVGLRGYLACRILVQNGLKAKNLDGGLKIYHAATAPLRSESIPKAPAIVPEFSTVTKETQVLKLDACGLQCPGPILETYKKMDGMQSGDVLEVTATDPGFRKDVVKWAEKTGNSIISLESEKGMIRAQIKKGGTEAMDRSSLASATKDHKTIVVFSNDLDRALASFVIANGALAMGKKVTMFFTFWGLNILRNPHAPRQKKNLVEKAFGMMMPKGAKKLKLSKMHFLGMGTSMMKQVMKGKRVAQLEEMIRTAQENGVNMIACQMSMDLMGIRKEELVDGIEIGGVATYLAEAEDSDINLFI